MSKAKERIFIDITYELSTNTLGENSKLPCSADMDRLFDQCLINQVTEKLSSKFQCTVPYIPSPSNLTVCDPNNAALRKAVFEKFDFLVANGQKGLCDFPCSNIEVFTGLPFKGESDDVGILKIYMKSTTKVKQIVLDYSMGSMIAEIGGYTGLLLGISFVNLTQVIDKITMKYRD